VEELPRALPAPSPQIERVVAVERPSRGCPMPTSSELKERRAAEVIRPFLNPMQRKDFDTLRAFVALGGDTGHAYRLTSRWNPEVAQHGVLKDMDTGAIICAQNQGIPPAEELLSLKFAVESLERRFLNKWQD
jgi:hypothetical protein